MDATFTEFSYGYSVTEELATGVLGYQKVRPIFPSLHAEGQPGGGYDVKLPFTGAPLYLQFKRAHFMKRVYSENYDLFNAPYYRMYIMPLRRSPQHELLIQLELIGNDVFYITPEFYTDEKLAEYYTNKSVFYHSNLFLTSDINHLDDDRHYVAFDDGPIAWVCSDEPREIKNNIKGREFFKVISSMTLKKSKRIDNSFFDELIDNAISIIEKPTIDYEEPMIDKNEISSFDILRKSQSIWRESENMSDKARFAGFLARTYFGCELFIVGE